jgi:hypothetical protein
MGSSAGIVVAAWEGGWVIFISGHRFVEALESALALLMDIKLNLPDIRFRLGNGHTRFQNTRTGWRKGSERLDFLGADFRRVFRTGGISKLFSKRSQNAAACVTRSISVHPRAVHTSGYRPALLHVTCEPQTARNVFKFDVSSGQRLESCTQHSWCAWLSDCGRHAPRSANK